MTWIFRYSDPETLKEVDSEEREVDIEQIIAEGWERYIWNLAYRSGRTFEKNGRSVLLFAVDTKEGVPVFVNFENIEC